MGIWETVTELVEAAAPWAVAEAEAPADNDKEEKKDDEVRAAPGSRERKVPIGFWGFSCCPKASCVDIWDASSVNRRVQALPIKESWEARPYLPTFRDSGLEIQLHRA